MMEPKLTKTLLVHSILGSTFISAVGNENFAVITDISVITAKIQCIKKNEGILAPKPLGRGIWRDFDALFHGDLVGFCLIIKTNPRGCPGGQPPGKPMISALF